MISEPERICNISVGFRVLSSGALVNCIHSSFIHEQRPALQNQKYDWHQKPPKMAKGSACRDKGRVLQGRAVGSRLTSLVFLADCLWCKLLLICPGQEGPAWQGRSRPCHPWGSSRSMLGMRKIIAI